MKNIIKALAVVMMLTCVFCFVSCELLNPVGVNDRAYYFTDYSEEYVKFAETEEGHNLEQAGTHWKMTSKKDQSLTIGIRTDANSYFFSTMLLFVNGEQVKSENDTGFFDFVYIVDLKKGDKLEFHARWYNMIEAENGDPFTISYMAINNYPIKEFDKSVPVT